MLTYINRKATKEFGIRKLKFSSIQSSAFRAGREKRLVLLAS
ncbi:MAG: hypothetical protein ACR2MD_10135 [Aridibacter sp.]